MTSNAKDKSNIIFFDGVCNLCNFWVKYVVRNDPEGIFCFSSLQSDFTENKNTTSLNEEERMFETKVQIKVLGYLIGDGVNREKPQIIVRENVVDVKISRERVITGDKIPWKDKDDDYRR